MTAPTPQRNPWLVLLVFLGMVAVVAVIAGLAATSATEVHSRLAEPSWAAPVSVYGPVWTVLYLLIALAGWTYWRTDGETQGFAAYGIGLLLNLLWPPLFFAGGSSRLALVDLVLLDFTVLMTVGLFYRRSKLGAVLLLPYLIWLFYITALNVAIVALNDGR